MRRNGIAVILAVLLMSCGAETPEPVEAGFLGTPLPGAAPLEPPVLARVRAAWKARAAGYRPRTRHLAPDGTPLFTNRLLAESSPYLLQHAHNPVNWYPWGDEAFETARRLGRPVLLSIGYSTCHWCHVMEEESFEDEEVARLLNAQYVAVKVDREERPDVDAVYMSAVQSLTGGGGWPMTVWLTPDRQPFYGGTYFPPRDGARGARVGFLTLLAKLKATYDAEPARVAEAAADLTRAIGQNLSAAGLDGPLPVAQALRGAVALYRRAFDPVYGGTARAPKFPSSLPVRLLLRLHRRTGDADALRMAELTLEKMAAGGIHDQVGGGFHRYSTDERWLVPHFEKMLYDNALLVLAYLDGYQATGREDFARVVRDTLRYVARDMTAPGGAFYSATDADSPTPEGRREEGWFFTWTPGEIEAVLGAERGRIVAARFGVTVAGNFEGRSILHLPEPLEAVAARLGLPPARVGAVVDEAREALYAARARRPAPLRDEKILAAWNGLMIGAFARAALVLGDAEYVERAGRAAGFVLAELRQDGRLVRSWRAGRAAGAGFLDDYAFLIAGLLDLFEATGEVRWLREAIALDGVLAAHFEDVAGGCFMTSDEHERLLAREKPAYDGAEPSGNSVQALNLLRLHEFTTREVYRERAERTLAVFGRTLAERPAALAEMLLAVEFRLDTPKEIVIVTPGPRAAAAPFLAALGARFVPNRVLAVVNERDDLAGLVPLVEEKVALGGRPTAYVCEDRVCALPTTDPEEFGRQIARTRPLSAAAE